MMEHEVLKFESLAEPESWVQSSRRPDCSMCYVKFTTFRRRHHCRLCGDIICSTCFVKRKAEIPMVGIISIKVCSACANGKAKRSSTRASDSRASSSMSSRGTVRQPSQSHVSIPESSASRLSSSQCSSSSNSSCSRDTFQSVPAKLKQDQHRLSDSVGTYSSSVFSDESFSIHGSMDLNGSYVLSHERLSEDVDHVDSLRDLHQLSAQMMSLEELEKVQHLGRGDRHDVWLVRHPSRGLLASKRLLKENVSSDAVEQFVDELEIMSQVHHPRIVELVAVSWTEKKDLQAHFEYMPGGTLRSFLEVTARDVKHLQPRSRQKVQMALDIAEALVHLHSFSPPIVHGGLQSHRVLLTEDGRAKLSDVGSQSSESVMNRSADRHARRWLAPELLSGMGQYDATSDVYAFGVILCELDTQKLPYSDCITPMGDAMPDREIENMVLSGELQPTMTRSCPPDLRQLAYDCLSFDPVQRPSAVEITVRLRTFIRTHGLEIDRNAKQALTLSDLGVPTSGDRVTL
ncbi:hypothetical protein P43SY_005743 [Pythium insidiosum]|uniref:TKL protein kinase n=1 Tax=Pythium insidiosum TaxID=114742 RepID=A0AAD5MBN4_PYTIN|nr:hypothetical protein P43SY_005743 [Pythium insidiosum]